MIPWPGNAVASLLKFDSFIELIKRDVPDELLEATDKFGQPIDVAALPITSLQENSRQIGDSK